jgi:hypothetical protein
MVHFSVDGTIAKILPSGPLTMPHICLQYPPKPNSQSGQNRTACKQSGEHMPAMLRALRTGAPCRTSGGTSRLFGVFSDLDIRDGNRVLYEFSRSLLERPYR